MGLTTRRNPFVSAGRILLVACEEAEVLTFEPETTAVRELRQSR